MKQSTLTSPDKPDYLPFNRYAYAFLLLTGIIFLFLKDYVQSTIFLNLSMAFDPFNPSQAWSLRPLWQRTWLIVHLFAGISVLIFMLIQK